MIGCNANAMGPSRISIQRSYDAPPERVFRAWTEPASVKAWLARGGEARIDPRPDGLFYLGMPFEGGVHPHYGRYLRVEPPRLVEFTWMSESTRGKESVVTLAFTPSGSGGTELHLAHAGLPDEDMAARHVAGWTHFLDGLVERFAHACA
jgi:uncharacterized protein YndB with AHSA1/START domain